MPKAQRVYGNGTPEVYVLPVPIAFQTAPTSSQTNYEIGQVVYTPPNTPTAFYIYAGGGNWVEFTSSSTGVFPGALTASNGNITATNGNLVLGTAGNKLSIATGANASTGTTAAMIAGVVTVASTAVTTSSIILYSRDTSGGTAGQVAISAQSAGSFTLTSSSNTETSTFNYLIIN